LKKIIPIGISLLIVALIILYYYPSQHKVTALPVTVEQLLADYNASEENGDATYLNKRLEVSGTITEVSESNGAVLVLLKGEEGNYVSCSPSKEQDWNALSLKSGDDIVVTGICTGMLMDVLLSDCTIQPSDK